MNLNFWQWLGLILLIGAGSYYIYDHYIAGDEPSPPAATQPM